MDVVQYTTILTNEGIQLEWQTVGFASALRNARY